jgi:hypothetical protein
MGISVIPEMPIFNVGIKSRRIFTPTRNTGKEEK